MGTKEQIDDVIAHVIIRLSDLKLEFNEVLELAQEQLRDYVVSKQYPIENRFEVWAEWCNKEHHRCMINSADVPLFGQLVEDREPGDYFRYEIFDWKYFLETFDDPDLREQYGVTMEDVMERLIETNFGSFRMDW